MVVGRLARRCFLLAAVGGLALAAFALPGHAQIQSCGEGLQLFIRNPDIVPDANGVFHVSGSLLVQFQVIGERADEIEAFGLSFGLDLPTGEEVCQLPPQAWVTGAYIEGYSVDMDKSDGFFIGINSNGQTSPQYNIGVAVHGYNAAHQEIARFWGIVDLDHCGMQPSLGCPGDANAPDFTMPWPILLPGDGLKSYVDGFTFEFNEPLSALHVELNSLDVTSQLKEWKDRPTWDQDNFPDGGPGGIFLTLAPSCSLPAPIQTCGPLNGPAYEWTERKLNNDDVVRIVATDLKGNTAIKEIHIGSSVAGGTISDGLPNLDMAFLNTSAAATPSQTVVFPMTLQNNGGGTAHPFASAEVPDGWTYQWVPGHEPVPPGQITHQQLEVVVPANATPGSHQVRPVIEYQSGQENRKLISNLTVEVSAAALAANAAAASGGPAKGSPLPPLLPVLALAAAVLAVRRASRRQP